jgi:hypothetical protein
MVMTVGSMDTGFELAVAAVEARWAGGVSGAEIGDIIGEEAEDELVRPRLTGREDVNELIDWEFEVAEHLRLGRPLRSGQKNIKKKRMGENDI